MDMVSERSRCFAKFGHGIRAVPPVKDNDVFGADLIGVATIFAKRIAADQVSEGELFPIAPWGKADIFKAAATGITRFPVLHDLGGVAKICVTVIDHRDGGVVLSRDHCNGGWQLTATET
ncbi:Uncharacterized protein Fot_56186 [Forsythia ovata]|uniref:Uncharacterized protein n=1 Tax=Forsythia ovata TaxID=205694 RepID=A0ABD1P1G1_9LAMI